MNLIRAIHLTPQFYFGLVLFPWKIVMALSQIRAYRFVSPGKSLTIKNCLDNPSIRAKPLRLTMWTSLWKSRRPDWKLIQSIGTNSPTVFTRLPSVPLVQRELSPTRIVSSAWDPYFPESWLGFGIAPANEVNGGKPLTLAVFSCSQFQNGKRMVSYNPLISQGNWIREFIRLVQCLRRCGTKH